MLVSLIKFTLAFHISIANRLTFATNVSLNCNTSDIYIFISSNIHIKFDLNVINNVNAEYNKKRMYEFLFLSSFVPEKITDHYREANRGATETIFDALVSVLNKGLCRLLHSQFIVSFCHGYETSRLTVLFEKLFSLMNYQTTFFFLLWNYNKKASVNGSNKWTDQNNMQII